MTRQAIIQHTADILSKLPQDKAEEISDFADFVMRRYEEHLLAQGIQKINADSSSFDFLTNDDDLYTEADLKVVYNA
jgi:hypothetical protein